MKIDRDYFSAPIVPDFILCKANKERIGALQCTAKSADFKYKDLDEIHFTTYLNIDNEKNPYYEAIDIMKYILLPDIGFFSISDCTMKSEGTEFEYKEVTAKSYECLLAQKYIDTFSINMGNVDSIDGCQFYNIADKSHSLLHLLLEKCPDWKVGHIDTALKTMQRSFEVDRQDIYSFLMNDIATAFECTFEFDTLTNTINIYQEKNSGEDTDIHISYNNLLKSTNISCNIDDIKTCLSITGQDDLTIREINMGYDKIYSFEAFNSTDYMSEGLYNAYNKWVKLRNDNLSTYTSLLSRYQDYYKQINYLKYEKMPDNPDSTDWTLYGLDPLTEKLAVYEQKQAVSMKAGHGNTSSSFYKSEYLPIYNNIIAINNQITKVKKEISSLEVLQKSIGDQMNIIINLVSMENNFTEDQLTELSTFIREDELSSDNFIVTETMTDDERFEMLNEMLRFSNEELLRVSTPQLSFSVDMANIFAIPEFSKLYGKFDVGNYIWVSLRDDYHIKTKLLTIHINFYDITDFSATFSNISKKAKNRYTDISEMIKSVNSVATSVSFNSSYWSQAAKDTSDIGKMLDEGLLSAGKYLTNGDDSEMVIDKRGIFVNTRSGDYADKDSIFVGGGRVLFTDDNWKSVAMAVGRADIKGESRFGVFADFCIASYIAGSTMESSKIITSEITSTSFNNGNGTFQVDKDGNLTANSATVKGVIKADSGYFGGDNGFKIETGKVYNGKSSFSSSSAGVYFGTDGISLGKNNTFSVDNNGYIKSSSGEIAGWKIINNAIYNNIAFTNEKNNNSTGMGSYGSNWAFWAGNGRFSVNQLGGIYAESGTIGGATLSNNSIHSSNGNWYIMSDGSAIFKNVMISGSSGGIFSSAFGVLDTALNQFNELVANKVTAGYIDATVQLSANYATIKTLDAVSARVGKIEANYISASTVSANYATISSLNAAVARIGTIEADYVKTATVQAIDAKFSNLDAGNITSGTLSASRISTTLSNGVNGVQINSNRVVATAYQFSDGGTAITKEWVSSVSKKADSGKYNVVNSSGTVIGTVTI